MSGVRPEHLDYSVLRGDGLRPRLRTIAGSPRMLIGTTLAVLVLLVTGPLALVGVAAVAFDDGFRSSDDIGFVVVLVLFAAGSGWALYDGLRQAGSGAGLRVFAQANGLHWVRPDEAVQYAEPGFAGAAHALQEAARTPGEAFLEVGERFRITGGVGPRRMPTPQAYLRGRVDPADSRDPMTPELDARLRAWAGPYQLHVQDGELTVLGARPLRADRRGRVREGLEILDELVARAGRPATTGAEPVAPERPVPAVAPAGGRHPGLVVLGVIGALAALAAVLVVVEKLVLDPLEGTMREQPAVGVLVVVALIGAAGAVVARLVRWAMRPGGGRPGGGHPGGGRRVAGRDGAGRGGRR